MAVKYSKVLKTAFKDKEAFPNKAKNIIDYLKNNPTGENNLYDFQIQFHIVLV